MSVTSLLSQIRCSHHQKMIIGRFAFCRVGDVKSANTLKVCVDLDVATIALAWRTSASHSKTEPRASEKRRKIQLRTISLSQFPSSPVKKELTSIVSRRPRNVFYLHKSKVHTLAGRRAGPSGVFILVLVLGLVCGVWCLEVWRFGSLEFWVLGVVWWEVLGVLGVGRVGGALAGWSCWEVGCVERCCCWEVTYVGFDSGHLATSW